MNCKGIENKIWDYIEGKLNENEQAAIESHLQHCSACAKLEKGIRNSNAILEQAKRSEFDPFYYSRLQARMESEKPSHISKIPYVIRLAAAASIAIVGIVGGSIFGSYTAEQMNDGFANTNVSEQNDDLGFDLADNSFDLIKDFE